MRLPFLDLCSECPLEDCCLAAHTDDRCSDPALYPAGSLHPQANDVPALEVLAHQVKWSALPADMTSLSVSKLCQSRGLNAVGLSLIASSRLIRGREVVAPEAAVAAFMFGQDPILEGLWRDRRSLILSIGIPIVGPSFSTWSDVTPYEHSVQALRSSLLARQLSLHNEVVPSIPLSPWLGPQIWSTLLQGAPDVAVDLASANWPDCLAILGRVRATLDPPPRLIVYSGTSSRRIEQAYRSWRGRVMFVSRGPIDYAMRGMRLLPDLSVERDWELSREELLIHNDQAFRDFVEALTRSQPDEVERPVMPTAGYGT